MDKSKIEHGHILRHKAIAIAAALKEYTHPLGKAKVGEGICEIDESRKPIDEGHMLRVLVNAYVDSLPDRTMPIEGHKRWYELCESSMTDDFAETIRRAEAFHEWLDQQVGINERMYFHHDDRIVRLDGEAYRVSRIESLRILEYLYVNRQKFVPHHEISKNVKGCRGDEKTIRRRIEELSPPLRALIQKKTGKGRCLVLPGL